MVFKCKEERGHQHWRCQEVTKPHFSPTHLLHHDCVHLLAPPLTHLQFIQHLVRIWIKTTVRKEYCADSQISLNILRDFPWKGLCSTPLIKIKKDLSLSDVSKFFRIDITDQNCIWCFHSSSFKWHSYLNTPIQSACWNLSRAAVTHTEY